MKNLLYLAFAGFILQACSSTKFTGDNAWKKEAYLNDSLLAGIERGPCFGACPQYKALIYKSGLVSYSGTKNVDHIGKWKAQLTSTQLLNLVNGIRESGIESMDTVFVNKHLADFPGFSMWICDKKSPRHIWVMHEAPPTSVSAIANQLDQLLLNLKWERGEGKYSDD